MTRATEDNKGFGRLTGIQKHLVKSLIIFVIVGVIGVAIGTVRYIVANKQTECVKATVRYSFDGAANGVAPDGREMYVTDIMKDEVLEQALTAAGMSGEISVEELNSMMVVRGSYPENIVSQIESYESLLDFSASKQLSVSSYHPTQFTVVMYNNFARKLSKQELSSLMDAILDSYRTWFEDNHLNKITLGRFDGIMNSPAYDYSQRLELVDTKLEIIAEYAREMYEEKSSFVSGGTGFSDIYVQAENIRTNGVDKLEASITMNAITKNASRLKTQYEYEIKQLNNRLAEQKKNLSEVNELLTAYNKYEVLYLATADTVTKIDGNSSETYDALVASQVEISNTITEINASISQYQLKLADIADVRTTASESTKTAVEAQINSLVAQADALEEKLSELLDAYNAVKYGDSGMSVSAVDYGHYNLGGLIVMWIKSAGPLCMLVILWFAVTMISYEKKRLLEQ